MKRIQNYLLALLFVTTTGGAVMTIATPQTTFAVCNERLLTLPTWYEGVVDPATCEIQSPTDANGGVSKFIWTIALNIIEMVLQIVGYIAVGFIIVGGYKYMISAGSPDGMVKARKTITNAVVGLVISIFSVAIVNLISGTIK